MLADAAQAVSPSIVLIVARISGSLRDMNTGEVTGPFHVAFTGTGFFASSDGYIVTAAHVAAPTADEVTGDVIDAAIDVASHCTSQATCQAAESEHRDEYALHEEAVGTQVNISVLTQNLHVTDGGLPAQVIASSASDHRDVAILKVDGQDEPVAILADSDSITPLDSVAVIGYPHSADVSSSERSALVPTVTSGAVNARRQGDPGSGLAGDAVLLQVDARVEHGNSGGPLVGTDADVYGIASFLGPDATVSFFISANDVNSVLATTPAHNRMGQIDQLWRDGLDDYRHGAYADAVRLWTMCANLNPVQVACAAQLPVAQALAAHQGQLPRPVAAMGWLGSGWPWTSLLAAGGAGLLAGIFATAIIEERRWHRWWRRPRG